MIKRLLRYPEFPQRLIGIPTLPLAEWHEQRIAAFGRQCRWWDRFMAVVLAAVLSAQVGLVLSAVPL